jgi:hypothetical protein
MSTLAEIEAVLPKLSPEELARVEAALRRLGHEREAEVRFDGEPWPSSREEIAALLDRIDALPALLTPEEADRFDAWHVAERDRQKVLFQNGSDHLRTLFT